MPTQPNVPMRRSGAAGPPPRRRPSPVWFGVGAIVIVAAIIAIVASSGGGGSKAKPKPVAGVEETRPVSVTGNALPEFGDGKDPAVGTRAPQVRGANFDGTPVTISRDGRPKMVLFVAHWCPHCQREVPLLVKYLKAHPMPKGVDLIAVATSTSANDPNYPPSAWLAREHWPAKVMADSTAFAAARAYGLSAFPYFVALDAKGRVVGRTSGEISTDEFAALLRQAQQAAPATG